MIRFLILLGVLFAVITGFAYLKETPGDVSLTLGDTNYTADLAVAAAVTLVLFIVVLIVVWLLRIILGAPSSAVRTWRGRRNERVRLALSKGFLAIASGDVEGAELASHEANKRQPNAPLTMLLKAQTAQLKGDQNSARASFNDMLERPETKIVGLRGLHIEAARDGEEEAARHYAEKAQETGAAAPWASRALLRYQTRAGEWDMALATLALSEAKSRNKKAIRRKRAIILTAKAVDLEIGQPDIARKAALEAHQLAPDLVPAALVAGRLLSRQGDVRRASKVIEATWKQNPHPDLAYAFAHARAGDSARDRLKRVESLQRLRPQADEGRLALARAAMEAQDWKLARQTLGPIIKTRPTQNGLILMAEIEEGENDDSGRAREWLSRAVQAPRDKAWVSDGLVLDDWAPVSPITGELDSVEWKVPAERLGPVEDFKIEDMDVEAPPALTRQAPTSPILPVPVNPAPETPAHAEKQTASVTQSETTTAPDVSDPATSEAKAAETTTRPAASGDDAANDTSDTAVVSQSPEPTPDTSDQASEADGKVIELASEPAKAETPSKADGEVTDEAGTSQSANGGNSAEASSDDKASGDAGDETKEDASLGVPPLPDDPGVEAEAEEPPEPKRFKLF